MPKCKDAVFCIDCKKQICFRSLFVDDDNCMRENGRDDLCNLEHHDPPQGTRCVSCQAEKTKDYSLKR